MTYKFPPAALPPPFYINNSQSMGGSGTIGMVTFGLNTELVITASEDITVNMPGLETMFSANPWLLTDPTFLQTGYNGFRLLVVATGEHSVTLGSSEDETLFVSSEGPIPPGSVGVYVLELYRQENTPVMSAYESFRVASAAP